MNTIRRLERLEAAAALLAQAPTQVRRFVVQGSHDLSQEAAVTFLREQGYEIRARDLTIIRCVIGAEDGRPVDLPLEDLTAQLS